MQNSCAQGALFNGMRIRARSELVRLFDARVEGFRFEEGTAIPAGAEITILQSLPLIYEGLLSSKVRTPVRMFLEKTQGRRFVLADTYPVGVDAFEWGDEVESIVQMLQKPQSLEDLTRQGIPPDQVAVVLATLHLTGMLETVDALPEQPSKLRLRTMATSGEHTLPPTPLASLRPLSGAQQVLEPATPSGSHALPTDKNSFKGKIQALIGKSYFEILRITLASKPEHVERAIRFLTKHEASTNRADLAMAQLARDAEAIFNDSVLGPRYRECVEHAGQSPKHLSARLQMEVEPKLEHAIRALAAGYLDEADTWITWAAKLDPARGDLRLHRSFLGFCRASSEHQQAVALALREMLVEETIKAPTDMCLQVYLACVVGCLGDRNMVQSITEKEAVRAHPLSHLIDRFTAKNSPT